MDYQEVEKEFDEIVPDLMTVNSEGIVVKAPLPDLTKIRILEFLRQKLQQAEQRGAETERVICREIFVEEVDWSEWGVSDKKAGENFDEARALIEAAKYPSSSKEV